MFAFTRFRYIEGISPIFYHYWGEQYRFLYLGLCHLGFVICRVVDSLLCWYDLGIECHVQLLCRLIIF